MSSAKKQKQKTLFCCNSSRSCENTVSLLLLLMVWVYIVFIFFKSLFQSHRGYAERRLGGKTFVLLTMQ